MSNPSSKQQGETGFSLLLVVFSVTAFWQSYAISGFTGLSTAGVFPMLASATMVVSALFILLRSVRQSSSYKSDSLNTQGFFQSILPLRLVIVVVLITGYVIAMPILGFLLASGLFLFLSFSYLWRKPVLISIAITLVSVVSVYLIFRKLFQVVLPKGTWLQGWF